MFFNLSNQFYIRAQRHNGAKAKGGRKKDLELVDSPFEEPVPPKREGQGNV